MISGIEILAFIYSPREGSYCFWPFIYGGGGYHMNQETINRDVRVDHTDDMTQVESSSLA